MDIPWNNLYLFLNFSCGKEQELGSFRLFQNILFQLEEREMERYSSLIQYLHFNI